MHRRDILKSVASATLGVGLIAAAGEAASAANSASETPATNLRRSPFIEARDGTTLFYKEWGAGEPVLFVHGWALNADTWAYQMVHLADHGLRCIAYDRRGHGRSSDPGRGFDYDTLADDLGAVIEALDLHAVTLVGHSMGCGDIVRYLTRHGPSRVARIALLGPSLPFMMKTADNPDGVDKAVLDAMRGQWRKDFPKWLADNVGPFFVPETSAAMKEWGVGIAMQSSLKALLDTNRTDFETDFRPELPRITTPTLIIHGDKDHSAPLDLTARRVTRLIPGSQLKVYEGAPHGLFITHMDRVNEDLLAFVES